LAEGLANSLGAVALAPTMYLLADRLLRFFLFFSLVSSIDGNPQLWSISISVLCRAVTVLAGTVGGFQSKEIRDSYPNSIKKRAKSIESYERVA
jgi:hypothetical protein